MRKRAAVNKVNLILCLHNHQPVGNFDHIFQEHYDRAYGPFLDVYEKYAGLPLGLHCSGPLWDWILENKPDYIERIRALVEKESVELLAGAYYEPILTMIPERDRVSQITMMQEFILNIFG
ncbi:alpha-amylase, partial [candidate division KSB1 bacterium]